MTPAEYIIKVFGGVRAAARALDRDPSAISKWKSELKGRIPSTNFQKILTVAKRKKLDITEKDLVSGR